MRLPREISGEELAKLLGKYGYTITRHTGSHMRLTTIQQGEHHLTVPSHKCLKIGALSAILGDVAIHFGVDKGELIKELF